MTLSSQMTAGVSFRSGQVMTSPPIGVQSYDFSYAARQARNTGKSQFRWRLNGDEWLVDEIVGMCDVDSVSQMGHVTIRGELLIEQDERGKTVAYIYPDPNADVVGEPEGRELPESHWRLCANLSGRDDDKWRLRNERTQELTHVKGYVGRANMNWLDGGSHVFHDGKVIIDSENVAHLI